MICGDLWHSLTHIFANFQGTVLIVKGIRFAVGDKNVTG